MVGPRLVCALLVASALLAACNKTRHAVVEDVIKQDVRQKGHPIKSVSCPESTQDAFDCTGVDGSGRPVVFKVTIGPGDSGKVAVKYTATVDAKTFGN